MVTTGGTTLRDDIMRLQQPVHILVGTPGRILDLGGKGIADLRKCEMFVMDEADKLLSEEFTPVIEQLLALCPRERQVMLFSATFPYVVKGFSVHWLYLLNNCADPLRTVIWSSHLRSTLWTNSH